MATTLGPAHGNGRNGRDNMTQWNPGPSEPGPYQPPRSPSYPPAPGYEAPPTPYPAQPTPYPGYPTPPAGDYTVTPQVHLPPVDPLISADYGGWFNKGVGIVKRGWKPLVALQGVGLVVTLLLSAPIQAYAAVVAEGFTRQLSDRSANTTPDLKPLFGLLAVGIGAALLTVVVAAVVTLASVHIGVSVAVGAPPRIGDAIRLAMKRILPLIGWQLLAAPIYLAGLCLCLVPVIYVAAVFLILPVVVAVERTNAISRCFSLFHAEPGTSVARAATIIGITVAGAAVGGLIGSAIDTAVRSTTPGDNGIIAGAVATTLLSGVISAALAVFVAPLTLAAYADLRARREPTHGLTIAHQLGITPSMITQWPPTSPTGYAMP